MRESYYNMGGRIRTINVTAVLLKRVKELLSRGPSSSASARASTGATRGRTDAEAGSAVPRMARRVGRGRLRSSADWRARLTKGQAEAAPIEQACPHCGAPMLAAWGASCGGCKPKFASPKTIILATADVAGMLSMTLGWLVVLRTPDAGRHKALFELGDPVTVLTRAAGPSVAGERLLVVADEFMSVGHAVIRRPNSVGRDAAFTLEDRRSPGPSANGTFVNGRKLEPAEVVALGDGDIIRVGTTELHFKSLWLPASGQVVRP